MVYPERAWKTQYNDQNYVFMMTTAWVIWILKFANRPLFSSSLLMD
jgi:hypothetical protein